MKTQHMEAAVATLDTLERPAHSKGPESSNGVHTRNDLSSSPARRLCAGSLPARCCGGLRRLAALPALGCAPDVSVWERI